jgi:hypothetical protein
MTKKERADQAVQDVLNSPLIRHIIASLNPDMAGLRRAIRATLGEVAEAAREEFHDEWEEAARGSLTEKVALANALNVPFKKLWPQTYDQVSEMLATTGMRSKPKTKKAKG